MNALQKTTTALVLAGGIGWAYFTATHEDALFILIITVCAAAFELTSKLLRIEASLKDIQERLKPN